MPCTNCNFNNGERRRRRVALRVTRIFNGARIEQTISRTLTLTDFTPPAPTPPLTYINGGFTGEATVNAVSVTAVEGSRRNRVTIDYSIPVTINYTDAGGNFGRASAELSDTADLLLVMPTCPYSIEVETVFSSRIGRIEGDTAIITGCLLTIIRVLVKCDLVICDPCGVTYPLATLTEDEACPGFFDQLNN